jgi:hypothetical protein
MPIVTNGGLRVQMSSHHQMAVSDKTSADGALYMHLRYTGNQTLFVLGAPAPTPHEANHVAMQL